MNHHPFPRSVSLAGLTCAWVPTGDARAPLACVWEEPLARNNLLISQPLWLIRR